MLAKELDYVRTRDGRTGTIVLAFTVPNIAYEIEFDGSEGETETVLPSDIVEIIQSYS